VKNSYQDKRSEKLLGICKKLFICKLLLMLYQRIQSHGKTSQQAQRKERMEIV